MVVCAASSDGTTLGRIGRNVDGVAVKLEVGDVGGSACGCDSARVILDTIGPTCEGIALVGRGGEGNSRTMVVSAAAIDSSARFRVGCGCDGVAVQLEVGDIGGSACDCDSARVVLDAVGPTCEGITLVGCGGEGGICAVVVSTAAIDSSARFGVGRDRDGIAVKLEVGDIGCFSSHSERVICAGRDH